MRRDATTAAGYLTLGTFGWFIYALGPTLPLLRQEQGTNRTVASLHSIAFACGVIAMGLVAVRVLRRTRRSGAVRLGMIAMTAGVTVMIVGSLAGGASLVFTLGGVFVVGLGGSLAVNATTATLSTHHPHASAAVVSEGNAVGSMIGLVAPLAVGAATILSLTWRGGLLFTIPLAIGVWLLVGRLHDVPAYAAGPPPATTDATDALPLKYWLIWTALIAALELAWLQWPRVSGYKGADHGRSRHPRTP